MKNVCLISSVYFSDSTGCKASCSKWDHINSEQKTRSLCLCNVQQVGSLQFRAEDKEPKAMKGDKAPTWKCEGIPQKS
ncbi:hypothetical protein CY35_14G040500 [Sphagnum magellanicum]|nr:hypothetical protein CY35_14G040500 [Sphagnum magellanicum]